MANNLTVIFKLPDYLREDGQNYVSVDISSPCTRRKVDQELESLVDEYKADDSKDFEFVCAFFGNSDSVLFEEDIQ